MGHLAKADGRVSQHEIQAASGLMDQMQLNSLQRQAAMDLFDRGKQPDFPLDDVLRQFRTECHRRITLLRMFLEIQVQAALADGQVDPAENQILLHAANVLGFDSSQVQRLIDFITGTQGHPATDEKSLEDAYKVIRVDKETMKLQLRRIASIERDILTLSEVRKKLERNVAEDRKSVV